MLAFTPTRSFATNAARVVVMCVCVCVCSCTVQKRMDRSWAGWLLYKARWCPAAGKVTVGLASQGAMRHRLQWPKEGRWAQRTPIHASCSTAHFTLPWWGQTEPSIMGLLQLRYEHDSTTIRLQHATRCVRFGYDSSTIQHPARSYVLSSNNEHVNSFAML